MDRNSTAKKIQETEADIGEKVLRKDPASEGLLEQEEKSKTFMEIATAIALALPVIGMITGGFTTGHEDIGLIGVGAIIMFAVIYYVVLHLLLRNEP